MKRPSMTRVTAMFALTSALVGIACVAVAASVAPQPPTRPNILDGSPRRLVNAVERQIDAIEEAPGDPERWIDLGLTYEAAGLASDAATCYRTSLSLESDQAQALYRFALCREELGDLESAERSLRQVVILDDSYAPAMARLGHWLLWQGEFEEAQAWLHEAREVDHWHTPAWIGLARVSLYQGRADDALELLTEMLTWAVVNQGVGANLLEAAERQAARFEAAGRGQIRVRRTPDAMNWEDPWSMPITDRARELGLAGSSPPEPSDAAGSPKPVPVRKIRVERPTMSRL